MLHEKYPVDFIVLPKSNHIHLHVKPVDPVIAQTRSPYFP